MNYDWDFAAVWAYRQMFLDGALGTLPVSYTHLTLPTKA